MALRRTKRLLGPFGNQGALANARLAATEMSQRRVEREEVELFLERATSRFAGRRATGRAAGDR